MFSFTALLGRRTVTRKRRIKSVLAGLTAFGLGALAHAQGYTINGNVPPPHIQDEFRYVWGIPEGDYYMLPGGDMGLVGGPILFNYNTLPTNPNRTGTPGPAPAPQAPPPAPNPDSNNPVVGMVVMWERMPSPISPTRIGGGGDIHICPGGVFHQWGQGSITAYSTGVGPGGTAPVYSTSFASNRSGNYRIEGGWVHFQSGDGERFSYTLSDMLRGSWRDDRIFYAVQPGAANCQ